ncbi:GATA transcription factor 21-like isoform X1 [Dioscorea cayenensis subsp. rotundata]|uniref:GATA transcription factor 21-like isoform X1 n=1 Tax=Dioscorea cayennensis subsp. rotundata TaxID=55577 RepID=A0AB40BFF3_DIOCR|nr:GATA transcription factor 21-like isoform X1 [Dioscorea cayenensis subsp. rotundata]
MTTPISPTKLNQDNQSDHHLFNPRTTSFPCTIFFKTLQDQAASGSDHTNPDHQHDHHQQKKKDDLQTHQNNTCDDQCSRDHEEDTNKSTKWMSSTMRLMRKMTNQESIRNSPSGCNTFIRVCSDCNTTKTPLWRSGPQGPKSLCNACGIRQRKARRAMAAAAVAGDTGIIPTDTLKKVKKQKGSNVDQSMPFKKRCKILSSQENDKKKHWFELSKSLSLYSVLPPDERDAAILLMALSYGLICG